MGSDGWIELSETDYGSKGRARVAAERMPQKISEEARPQLQAWWERVKATAQSLCPIDTGSLMLSIRIEPLTITFGENFEIAVSPNEQLINSQIVAGGMIVNPKTGRLVDYAKAIEEGHFTVSGSWVPPNPFLEMAINIHIGELYQILDNSIEKSVNTVWEGE